MTSTASNDVNGWTPLAGDDEDVILSQDMYNITAIHTLPSSVASGTFLNSTCSPLDTIPIPDKPLSLISPLNFRSDSVLLSPLTCLPHTHMAPSSDRRAQRNRSRDPGWIPRPRNAFIIFRCEYSREHLQSSSQGSEDSNDSRNPTAKTLSKRAADAWKQLSTSEKDQYKALADKEREEHARTYPHYRFRPMRRQPSGNKKMFQVAPQVACPVEVFPVAPMRFPSVLAPSPANAQVKAQSEEPTPKPHQDTQPSSIIQSRRRSSSAPNAELLPLPHIVPSHRDRRANSVIEKATQGRVPLPWQVTVAPSFEHSPYSINSEGDPAAPPSLNYDYSTSFFSTPPEVTFQPVFSPDESEKSIHMPSPLTSATSSLIGWNGEFGPPSPVTSVYASTSPAELQLSVSPSPRPLLDQSCPLLWAPSVGIPPDAFLSSTASYYPDPSYGDLERVQALEAYTLGLSNYNLLIEPSPFFPEDPLVGSCEDENAAIFPAHSLGV